MLHIRERGEILTRFWKENLKDNTIKTYKEIGWDSLDWIHLV